MPRTEQLQVPVAVVIAGHDVVDVGSFGAA
jgi:hypothetical protein